MENQPRQQTKLLPKESHNTDQKVGATGVKLHWHWLTSTLLSSQRTNTHRISNQTATSNGATPLTYTLRFPQSNPVELTGQPKCVVHTCQRPTTSEVMSEFVQAGRRGSLK
jgi:hypothetical protein